MMSLLRCWRSVALTTIFCGALLASAGFVHAADKPADAKVLPLLIIDGQNNHDWKSMTPVMRPASSTSMFDAHRSV